MRPTDSLNERQLAVLRWIADGCPEGVMHGHGHKVTARALQERRLVEISKRHGVWSATVTEAGTRYLARGSVSLTRPEAKRARPPSTATPSTSSDSNTERPAGSSGGIAAQRSRSERPARSRNLSPTEQLVADVVAAGGVLKRPRDPYGSRRAQELVRKANRSDKTPVGKRLVYELVYEGTGGMGATFDLFTLVDGPSGRDAPLVPVQVPDHVEHYHPAVSVLRKSHCVQTDPSLRSRALRILHAVAVEAERRGFTVTAHVSKSAAGHGSSLPETWHLLLASLGEVVPLRIEEEDARVEHVPSPRELKDHERHPWIRIPTYDSVRSGRLRIDIGGSAHSERKSFWADRVSWCLEDKLPELLREVAIRCGELRLRREAKARAEVEYRRAVAREKQQARMRGAEAHRRSVLEDQIARWRAVRELREYAEALSERIAEAEADRQADDTAIAEARQWLDWVTARANRHDPFRSVPQWSVMADLSSHELEKFMNRVPEPRDMRYRPQEY